jgi:hypothetical protein
MHRIRFPIFVGLEGVEGLDERGEHPGIPAVGGEVEVALPILADVDGEALDVDGLDDHFVFSFVPGKGIRAQITAAAVNWRLAISSLAI